MLLVLPFLLLVARGPTITITLPPSPIDRALKALSTASGRAFMASQAFSNEVVMARLKDASIDLALAHLAGILCAKWEADRDGITWLVPDLPAAKRLAQRQASEKEHHLASALNSIQKRLAEQPPELNQGDVEAYRLRKASVDKRRNAAREAQDFKNAFVDPSVDQESPAWRALASLVLSLNKTALLDMPDESREVIAETPTPMQHPFSDAAAPALARYRREVGLLDPGKMVARVELAITKGAERDTWHAQLTVLDGDGKPIDKAQAPLDYDPNQPSPYWRTRATVAAKPGETPLVLPAEALEARIALSTAYRGKDRPAILEAWKARLLDPLRYEPTRWHAGEDLILASEATDRNLIGVASDWIDSNQFKPEKLTASQVLAKHTVDLAPVQDGWIAVRDGFPESRVSRSKAMALLARCAGKGGLTVDDAADWVWQAGTENAFSNWLGDTIRAVFSGMGRFAGGSQTTSSHGLEMWASLGTRVRDGLRRGETISVNALPTEARAEIARFVYWYQFLDDGTADPTDLQQNGIEGGTVSLKILERPVFYGWAAKDGPPASPWFMDTVTFGSFLVNGNEMVGISADAIRAYDSFKVGVNRVYDLNFVINPGKAPMTIRLRETLVDPNAPVIGELPPDLKEAVEKARVDALTHPQIRGRRVPPPE